MSLIISGGKQEMIISSPVMNSAGMLGFSDELHQWINPEALGAFITNPISLYPRTSTRGPHLGLGQHWALMHTGLPNPGLDRVINSSQTRWRRMTPPVILHLLANTRDDMTRMIDRLEGLDSIQAIEIGLLDEDHGLDQGIFRAACAGMFPAIARLPANTHIDRMLAFEELGAAAITLGPIRGTTLIGAERVSGRLYGLALLPQIMHITERAAGLLSCPLITGAGIFNRHDAEQLLELGADAIQLDTVLWTDPELLINPPLSFP
jgi:dihydroorotate dehydrogenase (NAD+) catalytic subunit